MYLYSEKSNVDIGAKRIDSDNTLKEYDGIYKNLIDVSGALSQSYIGDIQVQYDKVLQMYNLTYVQVSTLNKILVKLIDVCKKSGKILEPLSVNFDKNENQVLINRFCNNYISYCTIDEDGDVMTSQIGEAPNKSIKFFDHEADSESVVHQLLK